MTETDKKLIADLPESQRDMERRASEKSSERTLEQLPGRLERRGRANEASRPLESREHASVLEHSRGKSGEVALDRVARVLERNESGVHRDAGEGPRERLVSVRALEHNGYSLSHKEIDNMSKTWMGGDPGELLAQAEMFKDKMKTPGLTKDQMEFYGRYAASVDLVANHPEKVSTFLQDRE